MTGADRATASCTRSSGESPERSICSSTLVGEALGQQVAGGRVAHPAGDERVDVVADLVRGHPPAARAAGHDERLLGAADVRPDRTVQHLGQPGVALEHGDVGGVLGADPAVLEEGVDGGVADAHLAERGQHGADVVEERPVRADDEHARAVELGAEGVEQPGGAVQADRGLAGAGRALHADARGDVAAHDLVLLGLDRRDDVAHRAGAGPLDLRGEDGAVVGRRRPRVRCSSS